MLQKVASKIGDMPSAVPEEKINLKSFSLYVFSLDKPQTFCSIAVVIKQCRCKTGNVNSHYIFPAVSTFDYSGIKCFVSALFSQLVSLQLLY